MIGTCTDSRLGSWAAERTCPGNPKALNLNGRWSRSDISLQLTNVWVYMERYKREPRGEKRMGEQEPDISVPAGEANQKLIVFAPRIDPGLREQVEGIRGITGQTVNEVGQEALRGWVENKLADEGVRSQAMAGIEDEERRLQERKAAIAKVLGQTLPIADETKTSGSARSRGSRETKK
jgi:hypothetical protein